MNSKLSKASEPWESSKWKEMSKTPCLNFSMGDRDNSNWPKLWSLYFAGTFDKSGRYWLTSLAPLSIWCFEELCQKCYNSFIHKRMFQKQEHAIFACWRRKGESNKAYFKRLNEIIRKMPTRKDPMIVAAFTYGLLYGELFCKNKRKDNRKRREARRTDLTT